MAAAVRPRLQIAPFAWLNNLQALLAVELAPSSRKLRTALRRATIITVGAALVASCHIDSVLGTYIMWLVSGAGGMLSVRAGATLLIVEGVTLASSVVMAGTLAETPWLLLPFIFATIALLTYFGATKKLGLMVLLSEVVGLDTLYGSVFAPGDIGWPAASIFGASVITIGVVVAFDNWLWRHPAEPVLMESLGTTVTRARKKFLEASAYFLGDSAAQRPREPLPASDLPAQMELLKQARGEGMSEHRHAILLAAITRVARISLEVDRLIVAARQNVPRVFRAMVSPEYQSAIDAIATALDRIAHEMPTHIAVGSDSTPPAWRTRPRIAVEALDARVLEVRRSGVVKAGSAEIENLASFSYSLAALADRIERILDEPPQTPSAAASHRPASQTTDAPDPTVFRYALKVGLCAVIGYVIGIVSHRPELDTILTTIITTALPTYGAALRKMILRIIGVLIGGAVSLLAIIIVTPNFDTLPTYMIVLFVVFYLAAYASLTSGRIAYAGSQAGTTFALVFIGLSPSIDIYGPLWRIWAVLLGTIVVTVVTLILWPVYAGDSLFPRLGKVIRDTLDLAPGGPASNTDVEIQAANADTMRLLAEILQVADDAQLEGGAIVNRGAIVEAAGTLRRIANGLASIALDRIVTPIPGLDPATESARAVVLDAVREQLKSWLDFFSLRDCLYAGAAREAIYSNETIARPLAEFALRLEENDFARIASWTIAQRRAILAELQNMRRLAVLMSELNQRVAEIPGSPSPASQVSNS
jgi:hypothetical protein